MIRLFLALVLYAIVNGPAAADEFGEIRTVRPGPDAGFAWPYYLFLPGDLDQAREVPLIVSGNDSGAADDYLQHQIWSVLAFRHTARYCARFNGICLVPAFPRGQNFIFTHALDRDSLSPGTAWKPRLDLQFLAMIADAKERLGKEGYRVEPKVVIVGHGTGGTFANRFTAIHPEAVHAAVIAAPGGWPLAPLDEWQNQYLPYPVGLGDLKALTGKPVDLEAWQAVPQLFVFGAEDTNDTVPFLDSYDELHQKIIIEWFGKAPAERWPFAEMLYRLNGFTNTTFKLYEGTGHRLTDEQYEDIGKFLESVLKKDLNHGEH